MKIDFVVTWVDGSDPAWQAEKRKYSCDGDGQTGRYRDWGLLRYWFRAVEKYAPWVDTVHFVTWGHLPAWLDTEAPKLSVVKHRDFIPEKYLPTFSSHPIELNLHRIPGLSEHFVYFNDDVYLNNVVCPEDFFRRGAPCDELRFRMITAETYNDIFSHILLNNVACINSCYKIRDLSTAKVFDIKYGVPVLLNNLMFWPHHKFYGFRSFHLAQAYRKHSFEVAWQKFSDAMEETCSHKFRHFRDVSPWLIRDYQLATGNFAPQRISGYGKHLVAGNDNARIGKYLHSKKKMLCINDSYCDDEDFAIYSRQLQEMFQEKFPERSSFEKE